MDVKVGNFKNGVEYWLDVGITGYDYSEKNYEEKYDMRIEKYEKDKIRKYKDKTKDLDKKVVYAPLIMQENGVINSNVNMVLNKLAALEARRYAKIRTVTKAKYMARYSALLMKYNAHAIIQHHQLMAHV